MASGPGVQVVHELGPGFGGTFRKSRKLSGVQFGTALTAELLECGETAVRGGPGKLMKLSGHFLRRLGRQTGNLRDASFQCVHEALENGNHCRIPGNSDFLKTFEVDIRNHGDLEEPGVVRSAWRAIML